LIDITETATAAYGNREIAAAADCFSRLFIIIQLLKNS